MAGPFDGFMSGFGAGIMDFASSAWQQDKAEGMQDHAQHFSADQARINRQFQEEMSNTSYQRATKDMKAAGLNPMLAYSQGGASSPAGSAGGTPGGRPADKPQPAQAMHSAQQANLVEATVDKTRAEADEIRARTPTHEASIDTMRQKIEESKTHVEKMLAEKGNVEQQTANLKEAVIQIQATVNMLRQQTELKLEQTHLTAAQHRELEQRIAQNLPQIERILHELERVERQMRQPGLEAQELAQSSFVGLLGQYLRALNPLQGIVGAIPLGRPTRPPPIQRGGTIAERHYRNQE